MGLGVTRMCCVVAGLFTVCSAYGEDDAGDLFAFSSALADSAREDAIAYERYLLEGGMPADAALAGVRDGAFVATYAVTIPPADETTSIPELELRSAVDGVLEEALSFAGAYIPTPSTILAGFEALPPVVEKTERGTIAYVLPVVGTEKARTTSAIEIDVESATLASMRLGGEDPNALLVTYFYGADLAPEVVVTEFSIDGEDITRWTMVDVLSPSAPAVTDVKDALAAAKERKTRNAALPTKGVATADVSFSNTLNTLPPISLGSTSCTPSSGLCFNLVVVDVCFNVGIGVSLSTQTTLSMDGDALVEYPVQDKQETARISFANASGSSEIDYSLAYSAEICGSFDFPFVDPCVTAVRLARGDYSAASGQQSFSSFLLEGASDRPVCTGDSIGNSTIGVNPGVEICGIELSLTGGLGINPNLNYCVTGNSITVASGTKESEGKQIGTENSGVLVYAQEGANTYDAVWLGTPSLTGTVTLTPTLGISAPLIGDLSLPLGSVSPSIPSMDLSSFTLSDTFTVELSRGGALGNPFGCLGGDDDDDDKTPREAGAGLALLPVGIAAFALGTLGRRRQKV